jgi:hypothetical protein
MAFQYLSQVHLGITDRCGDFPSTFDNEDTPLRIQNEIIGDTHPIWYAVLALTLHAQRR